MLYFNNLPLQIKRRDVQSLDVYILTWSTKIQKWNFDPYFNYSSQLRSLCLSLYVSLFFAIIYFAISRYFPLSLLPIYLYPPIPLSFSLSPSPSLFLSTIYLSSSISLSRYLLLSVYHSLYLTTPLGLSICRNSLSLYISVFSFISLFHFVCICIPASISVFPCLRLHLYLFQSLYIYLSVSPIYLSLFISLYSPPYFPIYFYL